MLTERLNRPRARWLLAAILVAISSIPYLYAWISGPSGARYDWIIPPYPEDGHAYLAWVKQAASGALLFKIKFTAEAESARLFHPYFLLAGWLCKLTGASAGFSLFLCRCASVALFAIAFDRLLAHFRFSPPARFIAWFLIACSSGLSGLLPESLIRQLQPSDLNLVDLNTLWSISWNPLFPLVLALFCFLLPLADRRESTVRSDLITGALLSLIAFIHPYDIALWAPLISLVVLARRGIARGLKSLLLIGLTAAPAVGYQLWLSHADPVLAQHGNQGAMLTPSLLALALGLGLPLLFAIYGIRNTYRDKTLRARWPLLAWIALSLLCSELPLWFQRKLLFGIHLPICMLAALGLTQLFEWTARQRISRLRTSSFAAVLALAISSTHLLNARALARELHQTDPMAYYIPTPLMDSLAWLDRNSDHDALVLAALTTSRLIPGQSGNGVLYGHWAQSVDANLRLQWLSFLINPNTPMTASQRAAELRRVGIRYALIDPAARAFLGGVPPWLRSEGKTVFEEGDVEVIGL